MSAIVRKVRSGGQTGVDIAALRAAKLRRIATGGIMPFGCRTLIGPRPDWAREFGLIEHSSDKYPPRTYENVRLADVTIRIAWDFTTAGERCTQNAIDRYGRPQADVKVNVFFGRRFSVDEDLAFAAADKIREVSALLRCSVEVNFAGNSEKTAPGIEAFAERVVGMILDAVEMI